MALQFRPVDGSFFDALTTLARRLEEGATLLAQLLDDDADRRAVAELLSEIEGETSELASAIIRQVHTTFVTPVDREDLHVLVTQLDAVMDRMDEAADLIVLYQVQRLPKQFAKQVQLLQRCAELTVQAMPRLASRKGLADYRTEIKRLEAAGDKQHRRILAKLLDGRYGPMEVMKLRDVIEATEAAIDGFETVATTIEHIVVKGS